MVSLSKTHFLSNTLERLLVVHDLFCAKTVGLFVEKTLHKSSIGKAFLLYAQKYALLNSAGLLKTFHNKDTCVSFVSGEKLQRAF